MKIQITLNPKNKAHNALINHLSTLGKNSGEAKHLLLRGFNSYYSPEANKVTNITQADIDEQSMKVNQSAKKFVS